MGLIMPFAKAPNNTLPPPKFIASHAHLSTKSYNSVAFLHVYGYNFL